MLNFTSGIVDLASWRYVGRTLATSGKNRVQLCGRFVVELDSRRIESLFPGKQGRILFAFLALNRLRPVGRHELTEALWGEQIPYAADVSLRALVSKLRGVLGPHAIQGRNQLQLLLPTDAWIDFEAAFEAIHRAEAAAAREQWHDAWWPTRIALNIAQREFLPGAEGAWVEECRSRLEDLQLRAYEAVAAVGVGLGGSELASAERSARALIDAAPFRESGYRFLMQVYVASGRVAEALLVYDRLRCLMRDELGAAPAARTQALHRRILEGRD
jgi:SARP family transcriptional regulator, regulator of embCAB operon